MGLGLSVFFLQLSPLSCFSIVAFFMNMTDYLTRLKQHGSLHNGIFSFCLPYRFAVSATKDMSTRDMIYIMAGNSDCRSYGFGYVIIRSPYTPYSVYLRRTRIWVWGVLVIFSMPLDPGLNKRIFKNLRTHGDP